MSEFVVPDIADNTTNTCPSMLVAIDATDFIRAGVPTDVPPNFITFMMLSFSESYLYGSKVRRIKTFPTSFICYIRLWRL